MTTHMILDFETLGQDVLSCPIIDCSYVAFEYERFLDQPYTIAELLKMIQKTKLSIEDQVKRNKMVVEKSSLDWWQEQGKEARSKLKPSPNDVTLEDFMEDILSYAEGYKIKYWWSRSNTFDPIILGQRAAILGMKKRMDTCLPYWGVRDTRSYIDAKFDFKSSTSFTPIEDHDLWNRTFVKHDSAHDIMADILRLQAIVRSENGLALPE